MRAFTLIEIMVVVAIIGLLATLVGTRIFAMDELGRRKVALAQCTQYQGAVRQWMLEKRLAQLPHSLAELEAPLSHGSEFDFLRVEPDPWGGAFEIVPEGGRRFRIRSNGQDGEPETDDDIWFEPLED